MKDNIADIRDTFETEWLVMVTDVSNLLTEVDEVNIKYMKESGGAMKIDSWIACEPVSFFERATKLRKLFEELKVIAYQKTNK